MTEPDVESGATCRGEARDRLSGTGSLTCLLVIAALALAIRLYHIGQQSIWGDEFYSVGCLGVKSLSAKLALFHFWYSDCTPLDFVLQHFWTMCVGVCPWKLRLLPMFFSMLCVPMIFNLGKAVWGKSVGLLAALFFALSPFHVWYGQTIRPYALLSFLVLLAMYSCLRIATHGGWKWWLLNMTLGVLLLWAHPFTLFFLAAEFVFLLWSAGSRWVLLIVWTPLAGVAAFSVFLLWLLPTLAYTASAQDETDYRMPTPTQIAVGFLGNDAIFVSNEFPASPPNLPFLSPSQSRWLKAAHPLADAALCASFGLALALAVASLCGRRVRTACGLAYPTPPPQGKDVQRIGVILLLCVAILPVLQLLLLTLFWRPCFAARYSLFCSLPLYLLLAAALQRIRRPVLLGAALVMLLLLYTYQLALFVTANTRTDWISAATQIKTELRHNDLVLVTGIMPFGREMFSLHAGDLPVPVESAYTPQEICERVRQRLAGPGAGPGAAPVEEPRVWAVVEGIGWDERMLSAGFDASLKQFGISHVSWFWPGMAGMTLYLFERSAPASPTVGLLPAFNLPINYEEVLGQLGPSVAALDRDSSLDALRRVMYWPWPLSMRWTAVLSLMLTEKGNPELGLAFARSILDRDLSFGLGHFAEAAALAALGSEREAREAFQKSFSLDGRVLSVFEPAIRAWFDQHDMGKARNELDKLGSIGYPTRALSAVLSACKETAP